MTSCLDHDDALVFQPRPARRATDRLPDLGVASTSIGDWLTHMLDQIDYGMLLVDVRQGVKYLNDAARRHLDARHSLQILGGQIAASQPGDASKLRRAIEGASEHGLRTFLSCGKDADRCGVAVVPPPRLPNRMDAVALLVLGKRAVCEELSADWYARCHGLTLAESQVLRLLCGGAPPNEIARTQGVAVSTVRTQIASIRSKTGARNIGALVREVASLPPLVRALDHRSAAATSPH